MVKQVLPRTESPRYPKLHYTPDAHPPRPKRPHPSKQTVDLLLWAGNDAEESGRNGES